MKEHFNIFSLLFSLL
ncbi:hypothetical protein [Peptoniphilus porci]